MPTCWIIAGPNGAGKTTFALDYLPKIVSCYYFINADLIAAGISPLAPERELISASRILLREIETRIQKEDDFAFETTLAGRSYLKLIKRLRLSGWQVELIYLALPSIEMSIARVAERVKHGGHHIPTKDIERRFSRSLNNLFSDFSNTATHCLCFINTNDKPTLVFEQQDHQRDVINETDYRHLLNQAKL